MVEAGVLTTNIISRFCASQYRGGILCRRSIKEYLNFLNISLGSLGESVSGLFGYRKAKQISEAQFEKLDALAYKLENGLLKLVESLERKRDQGDWVDSLVVKESNAVYGND